MKSIAAIIVVTLCSATALFADIEIVGKKEMLQQADLIAIVDIQELTSTDKTKAYADLIATAHVAQTLKGETKGEIKFRIERWFPCAAFDVSTGRHLVFLKKGEKNEYAGANWYMSYLYLGGKTAKWYDDKGTGVDDKSPEELVKEVMSLIKRTPRKADMGDGK
jgi:hypothetical protein